MKVVHLVAIILVLAALALAFAGQTGVAAGVFALSTFIELAAAALAGKRRNT